MVQKSKETLAATKGDNSGVITIRNYTTQKIIARKYMAKPNRSRNRDGKGIQVAETAMLSLGEATACGAQGKTTTNLNLTKEQMEQLYKLLTLAKPGISLLPQKGTFLTALSGIAEKGEPWIVDFGAIDHMTGCGKLFFACTPSLGNHKVKIGKDC